MAIHRITAVYFSPTGNARTAARCAAQSLGAHLGVPVSELDITPPAARQHQYAFTENDLVLFSLPVYAGRLPNKILPCIQSCFTGGGAQAVLLCSYGNRSFGDALTELRDEVTAHGFLPIAAAALVSEHAFAQALASGRPDADDLAAIADFARRAAQKAETAPARMPLDVPGSSPAGPYYTPLGMDGAPAKFLKAKPVTGRAAQKAETAPARMPLDVPGSSPAGPYYTPLGMDGAPAKFLKAKPVTDAARCTRCGACVTACPMGSIDADCITVSGVCIKCQACIKNCPEQAKFFEDAAFRCGACVTACPMGSIDADCITVSGVCIKCQACIKNCPEQAKFFEDAAFLSHREMLLAHYTDRKENQFFL